MTEPRSREGLGDSEHLFKTSSVDLTRRRERTLGPGVITVSLGTLFGFGLASAFVGCAHPPPPSRDEPSQPAPVTRNLSAVGVELEVPTGCQLSSESTKGGTIRSARAVLDWLDGTSGDIEARIDELKQAGLTVVHRFPIECQIGPTPGQGEIVTLEADGNRFPAFICIVPQAEAFSIVRCLGYDSRVRRLDEPPVPAPCDQLIPWQPILTAP